ELVLGRRASHSVGTFAAGRRAPGGVVYRHAASGGLGGPPPRYRTMKLLFDLLQAAGVGAAIGIRPFLPALLVGALAAGNAGVDFGGTDFSFLEKAPFLVVLLVGLVAFDLV